MAEDTQKSRPLTPDELAIRLGGIALILQYLLNNSNRWAVLLELAAVAGGLYAVAQGVTWVLGPKNDITAGEELQRRLANAPRRGAREDPVSEPDPKRKRPPEGDAVRTETEIHEP